MGFIYLGDFKKVHDTEILFNKECSVDAAYLVPH
jgi:hypothetical protein